MCDIKRENSQISVLIKNYIYTNIKAHENYTDMNVRH